MHRFESGPRLQPLCCTSLKPQQLAVGATLRSFAQSTVKTYLTHPESDGRLSKSAHGQGLARLDQIFSFDCSSARHGMDASLSPAWVPPRLQRVRCTSLTAK